MLRQNVHLFLTDRRINQPGRFYFRKSCSSRVLGSPHWCWTWYCHPSLGWLLLAHSHLLLLSGHGTGVRLLLEESPSLVSLLLQVLVVGHQLDRVDDTVVVEEHSSDLTGRVAVVLLDHAVDGITDLLTSLSWVHLLETLCVNRWLNLLLLLGKHLLLLLHGCDLLWRHLLHSSRVHGLALSLHVIALTVLSHVVTRTTTVVEVFGTGSATLATLVSATALVLAVLTIHLTVVLIATVLTLASHVVKVLHEVLLHLIEAALFALLVQLLGGHPELNRKGTGAEGS